MVELGCSEWLCEDVGQHRVGLDVVELDVLLFNGLAEECNARVDMLEASCRGVGL